MLTLHVCDERTTRIQQTDDDTWLDSADLSEKSDRTLKHVIKFHPNDQYHPSCHDDSVIVKVYDTELSIVELKRNRSWGLKCDHVEFLTRTDTCIMLKLPVELGPIEAWKSAIPTSCTSLLGMIDVSALTWLDDDDDDSTIDQHTNRRDGSSHHSSQTSTKRRKGTVDIPNLQVFRIPEPYRLGCLLLNANVTRQYILALASETEVVKSSYKTVGYNDKIIPGHRVKEFAIDELKLLYKETGENEIITALSMIGDKLLWCTKEAVRIIDLRTHVKIGYVKLKDQAVDGSSSLTEATRYILKGGKSQIVVITGSGCIITIRLVAKSMAQGISATMAHVCGRDHLRYQESSDTAESLINEVNQCYMMEEAGNILVYYNNSKVGIADTTGCITAAQRVDLRSVAFCHNFDSLSAIDGKIKIYARLLSESEQIVNSLRRGAEGPRLNQILNTAREWIYKTDDVEATEKVAELLYLHQQNILLIDASILTQSKRTSYVQGCLKSAMSSNPLSSKSSSGAHEVLKYFQKCLPLDTILVFLDMTGGADGIEAFRPVQLNCLRANFQQWPLMSAIISAQQLVHCKYSTDPTVANDLINACGAFDYSSPVSCGYVFLQMLYKSPAILGKASLAATIEDIEKFCNIPFTVCQHVNRSIKEVKLTPTISLKSPVLRDLCRRVPSCMNHLDIYCRALYFGSQDFVCTVLCMILKNHSELLAHIQTSIPVLICYTIFTRSFEWGDEAVMSCASAPEGCQLVLSFLKDMFLSMIDQGNLEMKSEGRGDIQKPPNLTFLARARRLASTGVDQSSPSSPSRCSLPNSPGIINGGEGELRRSSTQAPRPPGLARRDSILTFAQPPPPKPVMRAPTFQRRPFTVASPTFLLQFPEDVISAGGLLSPNNWRDMTFNADTAVSLCCFGIKIGKIAHVFEILLKSQFMLWAGLLLIFGDLQESISDYREVLRIIGCHNKRCVHYQRKLSADGDSESENIQKHLLAQGRCALNLADIVSMILDDKHGIRGTWEHELVKACSEDPKAAAQSFFSSAKNVQVVTTPPPVQSQPTSPGVVEYPCSKFYESSHDFSSFESTASGALPSAQWNALEVMQSIFNLQWSPYNALRRISTVAESIQGICKFLLEDDADFDSSDDEGSGIPTRTPKFHQAY